MYFKKLIHPEFFQGNKKKDRYFEGWYYKLVSEDESYTLAFIPGVSINKKDPHAFVQVFISKTEKSETKLSTFYIRYLMTDFSYGHDDFWVRIGKNYFSKDKISIDIQNDQVKIFGILSIEGSKPIKKTLLMPNIMGPFGYLSFMECYHGIVSMTHQLDGIFKISDQIVSFHEGKGYIEKDWGKSFPRAYVWLQSNHFKDQKTSFMFSYADIPFLGFYFKGLIANLLYQGKEYRFATYNFAKIKKETIGHQDVFYEIKKGKYRLEIYAKSTAHIQLASPRNGEMIEQIKEGLSGNIELKLYLKNQLVYQDQGSHAGIEIMKK
jgi:tocopherol cyclase